MNICVLSKFQKLGASSRLRFYQYSSVLRRVGYSLDFFSFINDIDLSGKYIYTNYPWFRIIYFYFRRFRIMLRSSNYSLVWIEKESLPFFPLWVELGLLRCTPYVLDYDDAVFHTYDCHRWAIVRMIYGRRLDGLMAHAQLVVCGNQYLAERATKSGAKWVEILPTVIDLDRYPIPRQIHHYASPTPTRLVWIGSPSSAKYLQLIYVVLRELSTRFNFVLRVIGADVQIDGVQIECVQWTEESEVMALSECTVGLMPLFDSPWERGKCGYKLIQYMACGLPVVASGVGVNKEIVKEGINGFLAHSDYDWVNALERLLTDDQLRFQMGQAGRQRVENEYCIQKTGLKMAQWITQIAQSP